MLDTREKELEEERATSRRRLEQLERDLDEKCKEAHSVKVLHPYLKWGMYVGVALLQAYTVTYIHTLVCTVYTVGLIGGIASAEHACMYECTMVAL